jgi:hypothetical protein
MIARHSQNLIFVVTKIDAVGDYQSIVENNQEKLAKVLNRPNSTIPVVPVSSRSKLAYLKSQDPEDLEDSQFAALENRLWQLLTQQRGQILLVRALGELGRSLTELQLPLQAEWETYQEHTQEELNDLEQQFETARERLQDLLGNSANWRTHLSDGLSDIRSDIMDTFQSGFSEIRHQAEEYLDDSRLTENPEQIAGLLEVDMDALISSIGKSLSQQAALLHTQIESSSSLNLNSLELSTLNRSKIQFSGGQLQVQKTGVFEKALDTTRAGTFAATPGAAIGSVIGGVIGGAIGLLFGGFGMAPAAAVGASIGATIGGIGGVTTGVKRAIRQVQERDHASLKREVTKLIKPFLEQSQRSCMTALNDVLKQLERSMRDELTTQISRHKSIYDRTLESIKQARTLSQEQSALKASELKVPLQQISQLQQAAEQMIQSLAQQPVNIPLSASSMSSAIPISTLPPLAAPTPPPQDSANASSSIDSGDWADG